ncbi:cytochrome c assembly protein [Alkalidesulfovibrio alkalitolerans DSM 16529]|uniref:Cytochrome c assembly protein n=1 Tax=Alkalidesulfovibrio alkalitolerans DSM 16529 TaxID=1121439 RepID=S7T4Q4_9BACT|nr:cytochrome c-type biogenesis CcmF C-terminal domain-containing protein [Alkalidesulfovibrio alkalitolerans]EPR31465.1 cytochrome c assembly protein [Alkalidesulfovibrio alkalitolerans DSM 16529]
MHAIAYWALLLALFVYLFSGGAAAFQALRGERGFGPWIERGNFLAVASVTLSSLLLLLAFVRQDYSLKYVHDYSDSTLPLFYAVTAFWAGQAGSLLFWAWLVALMGLVFQVTPSYRAMPTATKNTYWLLFLAVQAFFLLLLSAWSNPFIEFAVPPADGRGLNPLLRNPGMIFHPPLLFLGYAGFTVPACLALASRLSGENHDWLPVGRVWNLFSWIFLTAGIVLGGWWAYMELGWGGYWAWDPVENASLLPWFASSALIHTLIVQERRGSLHNTNIFLMMLSLLTCIFATYLVRSGVVDSLHAFGGTGVAVPLIVSMLFGLALTLIALVVTPGPQGRDMPGLLTRPGFLLLTAWLFLGLGLVVGLGTMWPVISSLWSENTVGLDANFYNRVCLPLFAVIALLLVPCPWLNWKDGQGLKAGAKIALAALLPAAGVMALFGYTMPVALLAGAAGGAALVGLAVLLATDASVRKRMRGVGFVGVHMGLALVVIGVAVSGPYSEAVEAVLDPGESVTIDGYVFTYHDMREFERVGMSGIQARVQATKDGREVGVLRPERRIYRNFDQPFAEVEVIPSLGKELYAVLLAVDRQHRASFKLSVNPLVNWVWIGSTLMCLAGFLCMRGVHRREGTANGRG